jgi:hypothetical protein
VPRRVEYDHHATEGSDCSPDITSQFNSRFCEQCLQRYCDPLIATETVVFSCFNQGPKMVCPFSEPCATKVASQVVSAIPEFRVEAAHLYAELRRRLE